MTVEEADFNKKIEDDIKASLKPGEVFVNSNGERILFSVKQPLYLSKCKKCIYGQCDGSVDNDLKAGVIFDKRCSYYNRDLPLSAKIYYDKGQDILFLTDTRKCKQFKSNFFNMLHNNILTISVVSGIILLGIILGIVVYQLAGVQ